MSKIQLNKNLSPYTSFKIGGNSDKFIEVINKEDLSINLNKRFFCLGGGSNIIFSDLGYKGITLYFQNKKITKINNNIYKCESGNSMINLFYYFKKLNKDFSVFSTIPGTIGGACAGNAGVPQKEIYDIFVESEIFDIEKKSFFIAKKDFFNFSYRYSNFHLKEFKKKYIIWSVTIKLETLEQDIISKKAKEFLSIRKKKQPWGKTGGSFFKNPKEGAAGFFLEQSGLKGFKHNGVFFSEKHANFLMNESGNQKSILELEAIAKEKVYEKFKINLEREVKIIDVFGNII
jgi:UDP-N-acetylmuramate dehydrogenase